MPASTSIAMSTTPALPAYALDGRPLEWNEDHSAVMFDSSPVEYFSDREAVSSTALKELLQSPAHMLAALYGERHETPSQRLGHAVHARVLERARFEASYIQFEGERRGKKWESFKEDNVGKEILNAREWATVEACSDAILGTVAISNGTDGFRVSELVEAGTPERNFYWVDPATGLTCKARLDLPVQHVTFDVKTTDDARARSFARQAVQQSYDIQAAFYRRARLAFDKSLTSSPFLFIAAELSEPYGCMVHPADEEAFLAVGDRKVTQGLADYLECKSLNRWPGYSPANATLKLPLHARYPDAGAWL